MKQLALSVILLIAACGSVKPIAPIVLDKDTSASVVVKPNGKGNVTITSTTCGQIAACACNVSQPAVVCKSLPLVTDFILKAAQ